MGQGRLQDIELVDKYLDRALSDEEVKMVEARIATDQDFAELVEEFRVMRQGIELSAMQYQLERLQEIDADMGDVKMDELGEAQDKGGGKFEPNAIEKGSDQGAPVVPIKGSAITRFVRFAAVAASISVLVFAGWWMTRGELSENQLMAIKYATTIEDVLTVKSGQDKNQIDLAMDYYKSENYAKALPIFETLNQADTGYKRFLIYYGHSLLERRKPQKALNIFRSVKDEDNGLKLTACYFEGLSLLYLDQQDRAVETLAECQGEAGQFSSQIKLLLAELSNE